MRKKRIFSMIITLLTVCLIGGMIPANAQRPVISHNVSGGSLTITPADFGNDYVITGTTTTNKVLIQTGYQGTITLSNLTMTATTGASPIAVAGQYNCSPLSPVTKVNVILDGVNNLTSTATNMAAFQVDQGAQISISAINPQDNSSGSLNAQVPGTGNGAGIGAPSTSTGTAQGELGTSGIVGGAACYSGTNNSGRTAGGNVIISSGTITAKGGHAAGIGGSCFHYYNGIIVIYGGIIDARAGYDAAGIGSGCPLGTGIIPCYAPLSAIIVLPPAQITAFGAGRDASGGVGTTQFAELGLAGTGSITYIGDPNKPVVNVYTETHETNASIYADLTLMTSVTSIFAALEIDKIVDLNAVKFGVTNASGIYTFNAQLDQPVTFFTDAASTQPASWGRPFMPKTMTTTGTTNASINNVELPLLDALIAFEITPAVPLEVGYSTAEALTNSYLLKITYSDPDPITGLTFNLANGTSSDFKGLTFYGSGGITTTPITAPSSFTNGDVYYIRVPVKDGYPIGIYQDVLRFMGTYKGNSTGYIRQVVTQRVVVNDTGANAYIKVTANPVTFSTNTPATATSQLTLNITHLTSTVLYDAADVYARYLISPYPKYDDAIADTPLTLWQALNVPVTDGGSSNTTAGFNGLTDGTYYIHWYVTSGVIFAHSTDFVAPTAGTYGAFGPYNIDTAAPTVSITVDGEAAAKTISDLNDLTVTITFSEPINATSFTVTDFTISPAASATIVSGSISVSATDDKVYTATLRPSTSLANGNSFTVQIPAGAINDVAGNANTPASNTVTVTFNNTTKPVVSFADVDPVYNNLQPSFTVVIDPNDFGINGNTDLYQTAGGTAIAVTTDLAALFTITPNGGTALPTTAYTALYSKQVIGTTTVGVVTFAFTANLQNSTQYTVAIAADKVYNRLGLGNDAGSANFTTAEPDFTQGSISANPNLFDDLGGTTELTIKGEGLKINADLSVLTVRVACTALGYNSGQIGTGFVNGTGADAGFDLLTISGVSIPANTTGATITYTFTLYMTFQGGAETNTGRFCDVVVEPAMSYIVKVTNTTTSVSDLTYGYNLATAQSAAYIQNITVENMGAVDLNDLQVSFAGPDQAVFASANLSPITGLTPGSTATFYVYLTVGQNAGTYAGGATPTNVIVSAKQGTSTTNINGRDALVQQKVVQKAGTGVEANLTGAPPPSSNWTNTSTIVLTPSATEASTTGDAVTDWKYAVTTSTAVPVPTSSDWVTVSSGSPATYNVPTGIEGTYYIHWVINTTNYSDVAGIVTASTVQTYLIDRIAPYVLPNGFTSDRLFSNATPFNVTVEFQEGVSLSNASLVTGTNTSINSVTPDPTSETASGSGLYTKFVVNITPSSGLSDGTLIYISVGAGAFKDKAGNDNLADASNRALTIRFEGNRPNPTLTTPLSKTNTDFLVTVTFDKAISGFDDTCVGVTNGFMDIPTLTEVTPGLVYTFMVLTSASISGTNIVISVVENSVTDAAGNGNTPGSLIVDFNNTPTTAILSHSGPAYENGPFDVQVAFSTPVTGVLASHFTITGPGLTASLTQLTDQLYTLRLTPAPNWDTSTDVTLIANVPAIVDDYGNLVNGSNTVTINYDTQRPVVQSIYMVNATAEVNFDPFEVVIVFDETNISSLDLTKLESDILAFLSVVSGPVINGTTTEFVVRVQVPFDTAVTGQTLGIKVNEGAIRDKATNPNVASSVFGLTNWTSGGGGTGTPGTTGPPIIFVDNVAPYVVSLSPSGAWAPIKGNMIITFNKRINPNAPGRIWLQDFGYLDLSNGVWLDQRTLSMPYGYLAYYASYRIQIIDFKDLSNNLQDPEFWGVFITGAPYRPNYQREIVFFAGEGIELSINPNAVHYIPIARDFTFTVTPKPGYNLDNLKVSTGNDFRDREGGVVIVKNADGSATVTLINVMESMYVTVTIGALSNETPEVNKVWAYRSNLYIQTVQPATVYIYTVTGALFRQMTVSEVSLTIPLPRGIYTVLIDGKTYKVNIQ